MPHEILIPLQTHVSYFLEPPVYRQVAVGAIVGLSGTPLQYSCLENPMDRGAW